MGVVSAVVVMFSLSITLSFPLLGAQTVLPRSFYPAPVQDFKRWYAAEFCDYLLAQPPSFLRGLFCLELAFLWPLAVATLYGVLTRRRWAATTSLMAGVSTLTSTSAILGEMLESGRATPRLLQLYVPYIVFAVIAILRGLCSCSAPSPATSAQKKKKKRV
ncbi:unnamed protein product [Alopecurus aequalis]